ncbi:MAG: hypothetical protein JNJ99_10080 [Crocinitomicaceae bacterium]|nr:hypothetical protein [Crocinitomicaceae bacterium]
MKKLILFSLLVSLGKMASADVIVNFVKSDKGLFGYDYVSSTWDGTAGVHQVWTVVCQNPGRIKCTQTGPVAPGGPNDELALRVGNPILDILNEESDQEILDGKKNGALNRKVETSDDAGNLVWVHVQLTWQSEPDGTISCRGRLWVTPKLG